MGLSLSPVLTADAASLACSTLLPEHCADQGLQGPTAPPVRLGFGDVVRTKARGDVVLALWSALLSRGDTPLHAARPGAILCAARCLRCPLPQTGLAVWRRSFLERRAKLRATGLCSTALLLPWLLRSLSDGAVPSAYPHRVRILALSVRFLDVRTAPGYLTSQGALRINGALLQDSPRPAGSARRPGLQVRDKAGKGTQMAG